MIEYRRGNLFDAPPGVALVHACNCQGSWGSGVAAGFRKLFEYAYTQYNLHCRKALPGDHRKRSPLVGTSYSVWDNMRGDKSMPYLIGCLMTSDKYASFVDSPEMIVKATDLALTQFFNDPCLKKVTEIHSPKMNAGLFNVPWEMTQEVIEKHLSSQDKKWIVWEL